MPAVALTDKQLAMMALEGDERAYDELFARHADAVFAIAMEALDNPTDAEEAVQETFDRAFRALPRFEWKAAFSSWIHRIATNVTYDILKARQRRPKPLEEELVEKIPAPRPPTRREGMMLAMEQAIERLREPYRTTVLLTLEEKTDSQIAQVMDTTPGNVRLRRFKALNMLREMLPGWRIDLSGLARA